MVVIVLVCTSKSIYKGDQMTISLLILMYLTAPIYFLSRVYRLTDMTNTNIYE